MINSSPQPMPTLALLRRARFWPLLWLVPIGTLAGIAGGAVMNAINGWLSPGYFLFFDWIGQSLTLFSIFFFDSSYKITQWINTVLHGMWEGAVFGLLSSVIYTTVVFVVSRGQCPLRVALRGLFRSVALLGLTSFVFGLNAVLLFFLAPSLLHSLGGRSVPLQTNSPMEIYVKDTYVDASIWGIYFGGIIAVIVGCIWFSFDWRKYKSEHSL